MTVTSGRITIFKDSQNQIGISISGGAPYCPCVYVVQIFDNTPAHSEGSLKAGDEITFVNGIPVKVLKKIKHKVVENLDTSTADALGLSRAILVNDDLVKKVEELQSTSELFQGMITHLKYMLRALFNLSRVYKGFSDTFYVIGAKESNHRAHEAFTRFASIHREIENFSVDMLKTIKPMISDLNTFITKVIPDMNMTMKKYLDVKFEYLSYCLKVKEMDEEEYSYAVLQEPLYRVETGNYEYRLILRCRQEARIRFAAMRKDVLVKIDLLDNKHVQDVVNQLKRFVDAMSEYHNKCLISMKDAVIFPIEMDLTANAFAYSDGKFTTGYSEDQYDECSDSEKKDELLISEDINNPPLMQTKMNSGADLFDIFGDPIVDSPSLSSEPSKIFPNSVGQQKKTKNSDLLDLLD